MKILVTANQVPFESGGACYHIRGTVRALRRTGHEVALILLPFKFFPEAYLNEQMDYLENQDFNHFTNHRVDRLISLQFPGYGVRHSNHTLWVMHQHRAVYDLYDESRATGQQAALRQQVQSFDAKAFSRAAALFSNSKRVARRMEAFNQVRARPLYHPPPGEALYYTAPAYEYVFFPSRQEPLKRQQLVIEAARRLKSSVKILLGGDGSQYQDNCRLIGQYGLRHRVKQLGSFAEEEKYTYYARALAVFFGPFDEDYGYVTLEAQLSAKPVITCTDSGGPLEFVRHGRNGFVCPPDPDAIAEKIDWLYYNQQSAEAMGRQGRKDYLEHQISWHKVVHHLLEDWSES